MPDEPADKVADALSAPLATDPLPRADDPTTDSPATAPPAAAGASQSTPRSAIPGPVVTLLGLAAGFFVLAAMRDAQDIIAPAILALVIAIAVSPMQSWMTRHMPAWVSLLLTIVVTYVGLAVFVGVLGWSLFAFGTEITNYDDEFQELVDTSSDRLAEFGVRQEQIDGILRGIDLGAAANVALSVAQGLYGAVTVLSFALALLLFLLIDANSFGHRFAVVKRIRPAVAASLSEFAVGTRRYLVVTTVFGLIVAAADVVLLVILDVPLPLVWGVLAFLTGYIPTVGLIIGLIPPVLIALLDRGPVTALIVLVGYLLINNVIQSVIQPKFIGDAVGLNIEVSFLSLVVWGFVLGPLGALLAIPMSLMAKALLSDSDPRHRWASILASDRAPADEDVDRMVAEVDPGNRRPRRVPQAPQDRVTEAAAAQ